MQFTLVHLVFLLTIEQISGDDCQRKLSDCMNTTLLKIGDIGLQIEPEKLKQDIESCFVQADCDTFMNKKTTKKESGLVPNEIIDKIAKFHHHSLGDFQSISSQTFGMAQRCGMKLKDELQPKLLECVNQKKGFENVKWPDDLTMDDDDEDDDDEQSSAVRFIQFIMSRGEKLLKRMKYINRVARSVYDESICSDEKKRKRAKKCISKVIDSTVTDEMKCLNQVDKEFIIMERKKQLCELHKSCMASLSPKCVWTTTELPKIMCDCASEVVEQHFDQMFDSVRSCMYNDSSNFHRSNRNSIFDAALKSFSTGSIRIICSHLQQDAFNPCRTLKFRIFDRIGADRSLARVTQFSRVIFP